MWTSIFLNIIFSILIIYLGHHLWEYLRDKYTTKKTVDLVNSQTQKYKKMMEEIQTIESTAPFDSVIKEDIDLSMEDELTKFMNTI